jgi:flavin reductase (DIM6/NTAB) family NADH-FMN oxidoreductase RutF
MDSLTFRTLLGRFATGVTVVTTNVDGVLHGMTANALSSVSLAPPLLLVCVDRDTHCHPQLRAAGYFGVSVLASDQQALSNLFARKQEPERGSLRGAAHRLAEHGVPLLDGALATMVCRLVATHPGGDHDIFVGEVLAGQLDDRDPLLFFAGAYRRLER